MENDFEKKMENLNAPATGFVRHHEKLKIGLMNVHKSARIGIIFILIPIVLVLLAYLKITILMHFDFFTNFMHFTSIQDQPALSVWLIHISLLVLPIIAIFVNLLAIMHFQVNKTSKELIITVRYKLKNFIVIFISAILIMGLFTYLIIMNH